MTRHTTTAGYSTTKYVTPAICLGFVKYYLHTSIHIHDTSRIVVHSPAFCTPHTPSRPFELYSVMPQFTKIACSRNEFVLCILFHVASPNTAQRVGMECGEGSTKCGAVRHIPAFRTPLPTLHCARLYTGCIIYVNTRVQVIFYKSQTDSWRDIFCSIVASCSVNSWLQYQSLSSKPGGYKCYKLYYVTNANSENRKLKLPELVADSRPVWRPIKLQMATLSFGEFRLQLLHH